MSKPEHTPGPWVETVPPTSAFRARYIEAEREYGPNIRIAEICYLAEINGGIFAATANAAAFAALPDLIDKLENLVIAVGMGWDLEGVMDEARKVLQRVKPEGRRDVV